MKKVLSWRWSRLLTFSAWKELCKWDIFLAVVAAGIAFALLMSLQVVGTVVIVCFCGVFMVGILAEICCADDVFSLFYGGKLCKVYVYKKEDSQKRIFYDICIKIPKDVVHMRVAEYESELFCKENKCFIYRDINDNQWYHVANSDRGIEISKLGKRLKKTVFLASEEQEFPKCLRVLQRCTYKERLAEDYICDDIYFPLAAGEHIVPDKSSSARCMRSQSCKKPYDYLLLTTDDGYELIGLYAEKNQLPDFLFAQAPSIMYRKGIETVILLAEQNGKYRELYRGESFIPIKNGNIVELDCGVSMYGRVLHFDSEAKTLKKKYEGMINSIGFQDGTVGIENGRTLKL